MKGQSHLFRLASLVLVLLFVFSACAPIALAAEIAGPPAPRGVLIANDDYGPWYAKPGSTNEGALPYQAEIQPYSDTGTTEVVNFTCLYRNGEPLSTGEKDALTLIYQQAFNVYQGKGIKARDKKGVSLTNPKGGDKQDQKIYTNGGAVGLKQYLSTEAGYIRNGTWTRFDKRDVGEINDDGIQETLGDVNDKDKNKDLSNTGSTFYRHRSELAEILKPPAQVNVLNMTGKIPSGCNLRPFEGDSVSFKEIFTDSGGFVTDLLFTIIGDPTQAAYDWVQPKAFAYTFWTPHVERGDTFFNVNTNCNYTATNGFKPTEAQLAAKADTCYGGEALGFSKERLDPINQQSWYMSMGQFLQWLLSGCYFVILFSAAVVYMVRGNRSTSINVMRLLPRLILASMLTLFAPFLIGVVITVTNLFTKSMLDYGDDTKNILSLINNILLRTGVAFGDNILSRLVQVIVGVLTTIYMAIFILASMVRQIALIGLIITAPAATFCLLLDRWQARFGFYVRVLFAVSFVPLLMALVFRVGMALNPIINNPDDLSATPAALGILLFVLTLWAMTKTIKIGRAYVTQGGMGGALGGGLMSGMGTAISRAGSSGYGGKYLSWGLKGVGGSLQAGGAIAQEANNAIAPLIPKHSGMMGGGTPNMARAKKLGDMALKKTGVAPFIGKGKFSSAPIGVLGHGEGGHGGEGGMGGGHARGLTGAFDSHLLKKQASRGERRVPKSSIQRQRLAYYKQIQEAQTAKEQQLGRRLTGKEKDAVKDQLVAGGLKEPQFIKRGGSYFVDEISGKRPGGIRSAPARAVARKNEIEQGIKDDVAAAKINTRRGARKAGTTVVGAASALGINSAASQAMAGASSAEEQYRQARAAASSAAPTRRRPKQGAEFKPTGAGAGAGAAAAAGSTIMGPAGTSSAAATGAAAAAAAAGSAGRPKAAGSNGGENQVEGMLAAHGGKSSRRKNVDAAREQAQTAAHAANASRQENGEMITNVNAAAPSRPAAGASSASVSTGASIPASAIPSPGAAPMAAGSAGSTGEEPTMADTSAQNVQQAPRTRRQPKAEAPVEASPVEYPAEEVHGEDHSSPKSDNQWPVDTQAPPAWDNVQNMSVQEIEALQAMEKAAQREEDRAAARQQREQESAQRAYESEMARAAQEEQARQRAYDLDHSTSTSAEYSGNVQSNVPGETLPDVIQKEGNGGMGEVFFKLYDSPRELLAGADRERLSPEDRAEVEQAESILAESYRLYGANDNILDDQPQYIRTKKAYNTIGKILGHGGGNDDWLG